MPNTTPKSSFTLAVLLFVVTAFLLSAMPVSGKVALGSSGFSHDSVLENGVSNALIALEKSLSYRLAALGNSNVPEGNTPKNSDLNIGQNNPNYNAAAQQRISNNRGDFDKRFDGKFTSEKEANAAFKVYQETNKSGKELVIGRLDDTAAGSQIGLQRLNNPDWSINVNDAWVQGGIDAKKKFYLGSDPTIKNLRTDNPKYPTTVFFRELKQLRDAGYVREGDYMVPPK